MPKIEKPPPYFTKHLFDRFREGRISVVRCLLSFLSVPLLAATTIHTDFEGGSLGRIERVSEVHFRLGAKGEADQDGRNRQANWYYFRVEGAPRKELILDIIDL